VTVTRIAYVTAAGVASSDDHDTDLPLVQAAATARNIDLDVVIWDDPSVEWSNYSGAVIRSTWDYVEKYSHFLGWLKHVDRQTVLLNPRPMVEQNLDKIYLRELDLPIVPTRWIESSGDLALIDAITAQWIVIKPTVSAGARDTIRTKDRSVAKAHAQLVLDSGRTVMAQPYLDAVDTAGEISVVCIDGHPSWAVRKIPALTEGGHGGGKEAVELTDELSAAAMRALARVPDSLYARVDLVEHDGELLLMELELAEPSLFIPLAPTDAADRLISAILTRLD